MWNEECVTAAECPYGVINVAKLMQRLPEQHQTRFLQGQDDRSIQGTFLVINGNEFSLVALLACLEPK